MDKDAPRVTIIHHPDVRRLLMKQKSYAEGLRGLGMLASTLQDEIVIAGAEGDKEKVSKLHLRNDLLLPLVKGFGSERVYEILADSLQCLGGSGYCKDYPHEQYIRDQKIDTLYEGTTAIQGLDLIFRKIMKDGGNTLRHFLGRIHKDIEAEIGGASFETERNILSKAFADFSKILEMMVPRVGESLYHAGLHSTRILFSLSELLLGWLLLKQAGVALKALETAEGADKSFYEGKCASARYFCREELPRVSMSKKVIEHSDLSLMELSEEAF